mmetsp:Transcript_19781/g.32504  ORF Transcript_19781/g.32504 Transcript_19781/m.32504 type:complete len:261 (+) Transcript_19781:972-1754(+)
MTKTEVNVRLKNAEWRSVEQVNSVMRLQPYIAQAQYVRRVCPGADACVSNTHVAAIAKIIPIPCVTAFKTSSNTLFPNAIISNSLPDFLWLCFIALRSASTWANPRRLFVKSSETKVELVRNAASKCPSARASWTPGLNDIFKVSNDDVFFTPLTISRPPNMLRPKLETSTCFKFLHFPINIPRTLALASAIFAPCVVRLILILSSLAAARSSFSSVCNNGASENALEHFTYSHPVCKLITTLGSALHASTRHCSIYASA